MYYPKGTPDGGSEGKCVSVSSFGITKEVAQGYLAWLEFAKETKRITISIMEQNRIRKALSPGILSS